MKLKIDCTSMFIPFIGKILPKDVICIYKQGTSLRVDMDENGKTFSLLYKGKGTQNEGDIVYINH